MADAWVTVAIRGRMEALLIRGLLEAAGLPVRLLGEALGSIYGLNTGSLGLIKIQVPEGVAARARDILAAEFQGEETDGR